MQTESFCGLAFLILMSLLGLLPYVWIPFCHLGLNSSSASNGSNPSPCDSCPSLLALITLSFMSWLLVQTCIYVPEPVCSGDQESQLPDLVVQILTGFPKGDDDDGDGSEEEDEEGLHSTLE